MDSQAFTDLSVRMTKFVNEQALKILAEARRAGEKMTYAAACEVAQKRFSKLEDARRKERVLQVELTVRSQGAFGSKTMTTFAKEVMPLCRHGDPFFDQRPVAAESVSSLVSTFTFEKDFEKEVHTELAKLNPDWIYRKFKIAKLGQEPDIGVFCQDAETNADNVVVIGELKNGKEPKREEGKSSFTKANFGQIVDYLFKTLTHQWPRQKIYGFLASPRAILFLRMTVKVAHKRPSAIHDFDVVLTKEFGLEDGLPHLKGMLSADASTLGFCLPTILGAPSGVVPLSIIGHGASSTVFLLSDESVAKVAVDASHHAAFENEDFVLRSLELLGVESVPRCKRFTFTSDGHRVIVMTPFCDRMVPFHKLADVVVILKAAHKHGFTHRDVRLANIRMDSANVVHLLDWGFAGNKHTKYTGGAFSCAAVEIIRHRALGTAVPEYKFEYDLLSLVQTFAKDFSTHVKVLIDHLAVDIPSYHTKLADAWSDVLSSNIFKPFADAASACDYDLLEELFRGIGTLGIADTTSSVPSSKAPKSAGKRKTSDTQEDTPAAKRPARAGASGASVATTKTEKASALSADKRKKEKSEAKEAKSHMKLRPRKGGKK